MKKRGFLLISMLLICTTLLTQAAQRVTLTIEADEYWWGGFSTLGFETPYDASTIVDYNMLGDNKGNQAQPLLLSSKGRYVWCEEPIKYSFNRGEIVITTQDGEIISGVAGNCLHDAFKFVSTKYFPSNGIIPDPIMFTQPQYNTWIELMYDQNQVDILKYAQNIIDRGFPAGVIMIDDNWQADYGNWEFSPQKFSDPKAMVNQLHNMGFKVMLWVCPFVSADSEQFRYLAKEGMLVLDKEKTQNVIWTNTQNKASIVRWWNGASAILDLSNPKAQEWFCDRLTYLVDVIGVDGFKFDAGDASFYNNVSSFNVKTPNNHTSFFGEIGLKYPLNEYRAAWKMAGMPLAQRLGDKSHNWEDLGKLIPNLMSQSVMGYKYTCPDMIGGGEYQSFLNTDNIDQELIVRSAQVHALMPMMQFSVAPWRVLSKENEKICLDMALLHQKMGPQLLKYAHDASKTGEPIVKPMEFVFPNQGFQRVKDQFMLGDTILVAPVIEKGARKRFVKLPKGVWQSEIGQKIKGGKTIEIDVPLERLPYFVKIN